MDVVERGYEDGYLNRLPITDQLPRELRKKYLAAYCQGRARYSQDAAEAQVAAVNHFPNPLQLIFGE